MAFLTFESYRIKLDPIKPQIKEISVFCGYNGGNKQKMNIITRQNLARISDSVAIEAHHPSDLGMCD